MIKLISAIALNNVIGNKGKLLWNYPEDSKRFKEVTLNSVVVMGATTFLYDLETKALPNRHNIVLSTKLNKNNYPQVTICRTANEVLNLVNNDCWIIGGSQIYKLFLLVVQQMEITHIHKAFIGDTYFPLIDYSKWNITNQVNTNELSYCTYTKHLNTDA